MRYKEIVSEKKSKKSKRKVQKNILVPLAIESCGKIVQGVNTTVDVGLDEIPKQAEKFGNKVSRDGYPPLIRESELTELVHTGHEAEHGPVSNVINHYYDDLIDDGITVGNIGGYDLLFSNIYGGSEHVYGLEDQDGQIIAFVLLNMNDNYFPTIKATWVDSSLRGKGIMKSLFSYFLKEYDALISDSSQSTQAKGMWQSLIKNPPPGYKVVVWNADTQQTAPVDGEKPWDGSYDTHLMLTRG